MHENQMHISGEARGDRTVRFVAAASFLAATALVVPSSGYNPDVNTNNLPSAEQAFQSINMALNPTSEALQTGKMTIPETPASPSTATPKHTGVLPQEVMPIPEQEPGYVAPVTVTSKIGTSISQTSSKTAESQSNKNSSPEKPRISQVNASVPTAFIAPEILPYVAKVGQVKSQHSKAGWEITPPDGTNDELQMVWWWNEKSKIGTKNMKGTAYLYAHKCHEGASIVCAGDNFDKLRINDKIKLPLEDGTVELTVAQDPITLPKTAEGIGSSNIYDYNQPGIVWAITCSYKPDGQTSIDNTAVKMRITGATTQIYKPPKS